jgi:hypothetical protein
MQGPIFEVLIVCRNPYNSQTELVRYLSRNYDTFGLVTWIEITSVTQPNEFLLVVFTDFGFFGSDWRFLTLNSSGTTEQSLVSFQRQRYTAEAVSGDSDRQIVRGVMINE